VIVVSEPADPTVIHTGRQIGHCCPFKLTAADVDNKHQISGGGAGFFRATADLAGVQNLCLDVFHVVAQLPYANEAVSSPAVAATVNRWPFSSSARSSG